jgi:hypothetical protein
MQVVEPNGEAVFLAGPVEVVMPGYLEQHSPVEVVVVAQLIYLLRVPVALAS